MSAPGPLPLGIVTGVSLNGIGLEVAAGLRGAGRHVIMACQSMERCGATKAALDGRGLPGSCECRHLDLDDFGSIWHFAAELKCSAQPAAINCLVNNAGVMGLAAAPDGTCSHWRPNHLGPFLLTHLLLPLMVADGRIVTVASEARHRGSLQISCDEHSARRRLEEGSSKGSSWGSLLGLRGGWYAHYARSKLENVLMTAELSRCLQQRGSTITWSSVSPSRINTAIFTNVPGRLQVLLRWLAAVAFQTPAQGASTVLHTALSQLLEGKH